MRSFCHEGASLILSTSILLLLSIQWATSWQASATFEISPIQLPEMLDWERYQNKFQKIYFEEEELVRKKIFTANAVKIFLHNIGFKMGKCSYYLSINKFSDRTPEELKTMYSDITFGEEFGLKIEVRKDNESEIGEEQKAFELELDHLKQEVKRMIANKQPGYEIVAKELDAMRGTGHNDNDEQKSSNVEPKSNWKSSGEQYIRGQLLKLSNYFIHKDQQADRDQVEADEIERRDIEASLLHFDSDQFKMDISADHFGQVLTRANDVDKFVDWRKSACLTVNVREQGNCGSSYAFTAITLMELIHCQQTGRNQLVPFSEEYMIDCGKKHGDKMRGCDGADLTTIPKFLMDWGVELRSNYAAQIEGENSCPYHRDEWRHAGYKRPISGSFKDVYDRAYWPTILKQKGPMVAVLKVPTDFSSYGGKVHQGENCRNRDGYHAMLLVGHGIEEGQEYWLYRNSYGPEWGEKGYFKLSKRAKSDCFGPHILAHFTF